MIYKITLQHLVRKPISAFFTIVAIAAALSILGSVRTVVDNLEMLNLQRSQALMNNDNHGVTVFVDSSLPRAESEHVLRSMRDDPLYTRVEVIPAEKALEILEAQFGETLSRVFGQETLPLTVKLYLPGDVVKRDEFFASLNKLRSLPGVLDVDDGVGLVPGQVSNIHSRVFSWANSFLLMVFVIVALLVSHVIRLVFESMRDEIETLKVLGAAKLWIFTPLLTQGLLLGVLGTAAGLGLVVFFVKVVVPQHLASFLPAGVQELVLPTASMVSIGAVGLGSALVGAFLTWPLVARSPYKA